MTIKKLTPDEIASNIAGEFCKNIEEISINEFMQSPYGLLAKANAVQLASLYDYTEKRTQHAISLDQYTGTDLEKILLYKNITRLPVRYAKGNIFAQHALGTAIPVGTIFTYNDILYETTSYREIIANSLLITSIVRTGTQAIITTSANHNLGNNATITITNTGEANFNITTQITIISANSFSIVVQDTGATTIYTGNIAFNGCLVEVLCQSGGSIGNVPSSTLMNSYDVNLDLISTLYTGLSGGANTETDDELKARGYERLKIGAVQNFTKEGLQLYLKTIYNITHAKVVNGFLYEIPIVSITKDPLEMSNFRKITFSIPHCWTTPLGATFIEITGANHPALNVRNGYVAKIYDEYSILVNVYNTTSEDTTSTNMKIKPYYTDRSSVLVYRANDVTKTFSNSELFEIKTHLNNTIDVFTVDPNNYLVQNLSKKAFSFNFTSVEPNLSSVKTAIKNNLVAWSKTLSSNVNIIYQNEYDSIIRNTTDSNGNKVQNYTLSTSGNILLGVNELFIVTPTDVSFI